MLRSLRQCSEKRVEGEHVVLGVLEHGEHELDLESVDAVADEPLDRRGGAGEENVTVVGEVLAVDRRYVVVVDPVELNDDPLVG